MLRGAGPERRVSGHLELHPGDLLRHRKESRAGAIVLLVLVVGAVGVRVGEDDELTYLADWFADCLAGRPPDSALTLVGRTAESGEPRGLIALPTTTACPRSSSASPSPRSSSANRQPRRRRPAR